jgi:hypothetical protein
MWSLPDIKSLNARAASGAKSLKRQARSKRKRKCEYWKCETPAVRSYLTYDIFSDDPKGVLHLCDGHDGYSGDPDEGYFTCEDCQRVLVDHYTWERYQIDYDGASLCLKCAAERYFDDEDHWLNPQEVNVVAMEPGAPLFARATGTLNLAAFRHVLGVSQPLPKGIKFLANAEFDSGDGHQISGHNLLEIIQVLNEPFCPVLDAAYQFAVSIGIYVRRNSIELKGAV